MMNGSDQKLMEEGWFSARGCIRRSGTRGGAWLAVASCSRLVVDELSFDFKISDSFFLQTINTFQILFEP